jgi:hypothetical protein
MAKQNHLSFSVIATSIWTIDAFQVDFAAIHPTFFHHNLFDPQDLVSNCAVLMLCWLAFWKMTSSANCPVVSDSVHTPWETDPSLIWMG